MQLYWMQFDIYTGIAQILVINWPPGICCRTVKTSNIRRTFVGNMIIDHSDVVGASPVGAAPTTSFLT